MSNVIPFPERRAYVFDPELFTPDEVSELIGHALVIMESKERYEDMDDYRVATKASQAAFLAIIMAKCPLQVV